MIQPLHGKQKLCSLNTVLESNILHQHILFERKRETASIDSLSKCQKPQSQKIIQASHTSSKDPITAASTKPPRICINSKIKSGVKPSIELKHSNKGHSTPTDGVNQQAKCYPYNIFVYKWNNFPGSFFCEFNLEYVVHLFSVSCCKGNKQQFNLRSSQFS